MMTVRHLIPLLKSELMQGIDKIQSVAKKLRIDSKLLLQEWFQIVNDEPALLPNDMSCDK